MSHADFWYVRFPDGRVLRAANTTVIRQELSARRIPLASTVRRSPNDEWVSLEWTQEFAEVVEELTERDRRAAAAAKAVGIPSVPAASHNSANAAADYSATVGSRLDPARLHLVGVRGYFDELLAALDSALIRKKLYLGLIGGALVGVLLMLDRAGCFSLDSRWFVSACTIWAVCQLLFAALSVLLSRLTYIESARLRPARWREGVNGLGRVTVWVVVSKAIVWGAVGALIVLLRWLPYWSGHGAESAGNVGEQLLGGTVLVLSMFLEPLLWPIFAFWWLLPPLLVVEDCTAWSALRQWCALLRRHPRRVFLYQAIAAGFSVMVTAPLLLLILPLFLPSFSPPAELQETAGATRFFLLGLACGPMLTYWVTSNVFIYLNLRYGASSRR